jgi:hypothetical protein
MTKPSFSRRTHAIAAQAQQPQPQPQHPARTPARINRRLVLSISLTERKFPGRPAVRRYDPTRTPSYRHRSGPAIRRARRPIPPPTATPRGGKATPLRQNGMSRSLLVRAGEPCLSLALMPVAFRWRLVFPLCPRRYGPAAGGAARVAVPAGEVQACDHHGD